MSSSAASPDELSGGSSSDSSSDSSVDVTSTAYRESLLANLDEVARAKYGVQTEEEKAKCAAAAKVASFSAFDTNADGVVDVEEVQQGLIDKFGVSATLAEIRAAIKDFDANGDGVLEVHSDSCQLSAPSTALLSEMDIFRAILTHAQLVNKSYFQGLFSFPAPHLMLESCLCSMQSTSPHICQLCSCSICRWMSSRLGF